MRSATSNRQPNNLSSFGDNNVPEAESSIIRRFDLHFDCWNRYSVR